MSLHETVHTTAAYLQSTVGVPQGPSPSRPLHLALSWAPWPSESGWLSNVRHQQGWSGEESKDSVESPPAASWQVLLAEPDFLFLRPQLLCGSGLSPQPPLWHGSVTPPPLVLWPLRAAAASLVLHHLLLAPSPGPHLGN